MSNKSGGLRLQCAEAMEPDWSCCFLSLPPPPPVTPCDVDSNGGFNLAWTLHQSFHPSAGLFASVGQKVGVGQLLGEGVGLREKGKKKAVKIKIKVGNSNLKRLISGGIAGAVSRTVVAPLETIRTHLMVGSNGNSSTEVFESIMKNEGWTGLLRGNLVNVIRVAPSKAIEAFAPVYK